MNGQLNLWGERPRTFGVNGRELLGWTATNFWGERPRTYGVNGHGFKGERRLLRWTATDFWGEWPWTSGVNGHEFKGERKLLRWTATNFRISPNLGLGSVLNLGEGEFKHWNTVISKLGLGWIIIQDLSKFQIMVRMSFNLKLWPVR